VAIDKIGHFNFATDHQQPQLGSCCPVYVTAYYH